MTKVTVELSMSLDGYATGPDVSPKDPWVESARHCTVMSQEVGRV
jgi:hypothetical protein